MTTSDVNKTVEAVSPANDPEVLHVAIGAGVKQPLVNIKGVCLLPTPAFIEGNDNSVTLHNVKIMGRVDIGDNVDLRDGVVLFRDVKIADDVTIMEHAVIGASSFIGTGSVISPSAVIGKNVSILHEGTVCSNAVIMDNVKAGDDLLVGSYAVVGEGVTIGDSVAIGDSVIIPNMLHIPSYLAISKVAPDVLEIIPRFRDGTPRFFLIVSLRTQAVSVVHESDESKELLCIPAIELEGYTGILEKLDLLQANLHIEDGESSNLFRDMFQLASDLLKLSAPPRVKFYGQPIPWEGEY